MKTTAAVARILLGANSNSGEIRLSLNAFGVSSMSRSRGRIKKTEKRLWFHLFKKQTRAWLPVSGSRKQQRQEQEQRFPHKEATNYLIVLSHVL